MWLKILLGLCGSQCVTGNIAQIDGKINSTNYQQYLVVGVVG